MLEFDYKITDEAGLHARPCGLLLKIAKGFSSEITVTVGEKSSKATKLIPLMSLGIKCGDTVTVTVEGEDEQTAFNEIKLFFEKNL